MVFGIAINSLKITMILQSDRNDVNLGPARACGNRLQETVKLLYGKSYVYPLNKGR